MAKTLAAHYHGRVAYPKPTPVPKEPILQESRFAKEPQNGKPLKNHKMESPEEIQSEPEQTEQETS
jgi:hypothetical protein